MAGRRIQSAAGNRRITLGRQKPQQKIKMPLPKPNRGDPLRAADIRQIALQCEMNILRPGAGYNVRRTAGGTTLEFKPNLLLPSTAPEGSGAPDASQQVYLGRFPGDPDGSPDHIWQYAMDGTPRRIVPVWHLILEGGYIAPA